MSEIVLMKGNEAIAEAALRAGCKAYFGYPITPQSEVLEYLSIHGEKRGMIVLQAESELAAINMIYGAAGAGARVMTTSSSPGISLMQEGLSYISSSQLPCLVVNVNRGGPGLGTIQPSQGDYFQATKGGGHGDYHLLVLAPATVQEMADLVFDAFDLADKYRNPVMILTDGALGQMMEKVQFREYDPSKRKTPTWATTGKNGRKERNIITSLFIQPEEMEKINLQLQEKYRRMAAEEIRYQEIMVDDAEYLLVAYGLSARICHKTVLLAREKGIKAGLLRPITLFPFPYTRINKLANQLKAVLTVEMNAGQMLEDVRLGVDGKIPVKFFGRMGGVIPTPDEVLQQLENIVSHNSSRPSRKVGIGEMEASV